MDIPSGKGLDSFGKSSFFRENCGKLTFPMGETPEKIWLINVDQMDFQKPMSSYML